MSVLTSLKFVYPLNAGEVQEQFFPSCADAKLKGIGQDNLRWRPSFHITAPHGWLNDPCGLGYDRATGLYHLSFQWNPKANDWGNISWGHAVSYDLVVWEVSPEPCLTPSTEEDLCGIFTGCLWPRDINGNADALTYVYTSVKRLPIHYTLPYVTGSETLSLATSRDHGATWQRVEGNPILSGPPPGIEVTAWRDPFVGIWPATGDLYGFISGGINGETPTVFVYKINPHNLKEWKYLGPLVKVGLNHQPSRWSGDLGINWEAANWVSLAGQGNSSTHFVIMGAEGCLNPGKIQPSPSRALLWMSVNPCFGGQRNDIDMPLTGYSFSGILDHGCGYAANSFWDPVTKQHTVYCWITEDDLADPLRYQQGWSGVISLPRVIKLITLYHVKHARHSLLNDITSIEIETDSEGTHTVRTLGVHPDSRLESLRAVSCRTSIKNISLGVFCQRPFSPDNCIPVKTRQWEMQAEFSVSQRCKLVGIKISISSSNSHNWTILAWAPSSETFIVQRPPAPPGSGINHSPIAAPHTLFSFSNAFGEEQEETLRVRVFFDASVMEVFVNERTVISTRIYLDPPDIELCAGNMCFFAEPEESESSQYSAPPPAVLLHADLWDGLQAPRRSVE